MLTLLACRLPGCLPGLLAWLLLGCRPRTAVGGLEEADRSAQPPPRRPN
jgi:hypothetical protein